jgi:hypothetical protein
MAVEEFANPLCTSHSLYHLRKLGNILQHQIDSVSAAWLPNNTCEVLYDPRTCFLEISPVIYTTIKQGNINFSKSTPQLYPV